MTVAVCTRCGAMKHGALTPCPQCKFDPEGNEDKAKAMVLTDHFFPKEELEKISERIKNGQAVIYPEEVVGAYIKTFEKNPNMGKVPVSLKIGCQIIIVGAFVVIVWMIIRYIYNQGLGPM